MEWTQQKVRRLAKIQTNLQVMQAQKRLGHLSKQNPETLKLP